MPYSTHRMHSGSSKRLPSIPPMSITGQPKSAQIRVTVALASASLPQMNMSGGPPGSCGSTMSELPTILNAFTTLAAGSQRCTCSPAESFHPRSRAGGAFGAKTSGFVASITTLPARFRAPASCSALSVPLHSVARTITSPNAAASAKLPPLAFGPAAFTNAASFGLFASREPIFTSCPRRANPVPSARPTSPVPRTPIFTVPPSCAVPEAASRQPSACEPGHPCVQVLHPEPDADDVRLLAPLPVTVGGSHEGAVRQQLQPGVRGVPAVHVVHQSRAVPAVPSSEEVFVPPHPDDPVPLRRAACRHVPEGDDQPPVRCVARHVPITGELPGQLARDAPLRPLVGRDDDLRGRTAPVLAEERRELPAVGRADQSRLAQVEGRVLGDGARCAPGEAAVGGLRG